MVSKVVVSRDSGRTSGKPKKKHLHHDVINLKKSKSMGQKEKKGEKHLNQCCVSEAFQNVLIVGYQELWGGKRGN